MSSNPFFDLFEFRTRWRHLAEEHSGGRFVLPAVVSIESGLHDVGDSTTVAITTHAGPTDGHILIEETGVLNQHYVHLYFRPDYQDYDFDEESGALLISGSSEKMGGDYSVTIQPGD